MPLKPHYEGIVFDLDKTAVKGGSLEVDQQTVNAMMDVHRMGGYAIAATGRAVSFATPIVEQLGLRHGSILGNGAVVHHRDPSKNSSWSKMLDGEALHNIANLANSIGKTLSVPGPDRENRDPNTYILGSEGAWITDVTPDVATNVIEELGIIGEFHIYPSPAWNATDEGNLDINIGHHEAQKHLALAHLLDELELDPARMIAAGDGLNDISFMQMCGVKVAPLDAHPDVLAIADLEIPSQEVGGFKFALRMVSEQ